MGWYINVNDDSVKLFGSPPPAGSPWTGPAPDGFPSRDAAVAAEGGTPPPSGGGGSKGGGSSGWFVVSTVTGKGGGLTVQQFSGADYAQAVAWTRTGLAWGPYPDQQKAQAQLAAIRAGKVPNPVGVQTGAPGTNNGGLKVPGVSGIDAIAAGVAKFVNAVTDPLMWRSLGWLGVGLILAFAGVMLWLRVPQKVGKVAEDVAGTAVKAAAVA